MNDTKRQQFLRVYTTSRSPVHLPQHSTLASIRAKNVPIELLQILRSRRFDRMRTADNAQTHIGAEWTLMHSSTHTTTSILINRQSTRCQKGTVNAFQMILCTLDETPLRPSHSTATLPNYYRRASNKQPTSFPMTQVSLEQRLCK